MSALGPVPKNWPGFTYIRLEDYELDINFDEAETKRKSDQSCNDRVKIFCKNIVVIE